MTTKLKIDLSQGILEVEGSETFVKAIYTDFKANFVEPDGRATEEETALAAKSKRIKTPRSPKIRRGTTPVPVEPPTDEAIPAPTPVVSEVIPEPLPEAVPPPPPPEPEPSLPAAEIKVPAPTYTYLQTLELGHTSGHPSLVEFMDAKLPITNEERNLVFLYYLQHILKVKPVTLDHVYTCYREAKIRAPLNIENSLRLTAEHRGWIKANQNGSMSVTPEGKLYVEKQLPKKVKN
ncbi:MAG: hypothetical protein DPW09_04350 [Anaerolineae bacterium]|nr:hypothetical protein [Anaerolineales bacterium]MCQ3972662.1 hypothetical protein [Anaerolineae bacterium]